MFSFVNKIEFKLNQAFASNLYFVTYFVFLVVLFIGQKLSYIAIANSSKNPEKIQKMA